MAFTLGPRATSAGYRLAAFDQIGSTNAEAMSRARDGERGPMWFVTSEQTAGRGRRHRAWIAPRGNLASSILEVMDVPPAVAATLGFAAGLALEAALRKVSIEATLRRPDRIIQFSLKWPNDVLAGRQKLCRHPAGGRSRGRQSVSPSWSASAPMSSPLPRVRRHPRRRWRRSASRSAPRSCSGRCRTPGSSSAASGTRAAALSISGGCGWNAPLGFGERVAIQTGRRAVEGIFDTIDESRLHDRPDGEGKRVPITAGDVYFGSAASVGAA